MARPARTLKRIALLDAQTTPFPPHAREPWAEAVDMVDVYDLPGTDLRRHAGLVIEGMVDQEFLYHHRELIRAFLDDAKVLVFSGHLLRPWLPGCGPFVPKHVRSFRDYTVRVVMPHPIFEGVNPYEMTFRKGVAGFFARGHHCPPSGAEVLLALEGGEPVVYLDRHTTPGTILVHSGQSLLAWSGGNTSAGRIRRQLLEWIREEAKRP
jgi:hypothetical protein